MPRTDVAKKFHFRLISKPLSVTQQRIDDRALGISAAAAFDGIPRKRALEAFEIGYFLPNASNAADRNFTNFAAAVGLRDFGAL